MDYAPRRIRADTRTCIHTHPHIPDKRNAQTRMYGHVRRLNHGSEQTLKGHRSGQTSSKSGMMGYLVKKTRLDNMDLNAQKLVTLKQEKLPELSSQTWDHGAKF